MLPSYFCPTDLPAPPIYSKVNPADAPILTLALTSDSMPLPQVEDLADTTFAQKISQLPGSGWSASAAARTCGTHPGESNGSGLLRSQPGAVANGHRASKRQPGEGQLQNNRLAYTIGANDQLFDPKQYADTIIAYKNGAAVRVSDVASVIQGLKTPIRRLG